MSQHSCWNGRINIINENSKTYPLFLQSTALESYAHPPVPYESNALQKRFFSLKNIEFIQHSIRAQVYAQSGNTYSISRQSVVTIKIILKSIFLQYGKNLKSNIEEQVELLNTRVLKYSVSNILTNIKMYMMYKKDVSTLPVPIRYPTYTSTHGTKSEQNIIY